MMMVEQCAAVQASAKGKRRCAGMSAVNVDASYGLYTKIIWIYFEYVFFPGLDQQYDVCLDVLPPSIESQFNSEVAGDLLADDIILDDLDEEIEKDRGEHYSTLE